MYRHLGFSLIEFLIVIVIIAILAIMPLFNWPGTSINIGAEAQAFANDIRYTQSLSMTKNLRYHIAQITSTTYQIISSAGTPIILSNGLTTMTLNNGISFSSWGNLTNNLVEFDGRGVPYATVGSTTPLTVGTVYQITLAGGGQTKSITVTPQTGKVTVL